MDLPSLRLACPLRRSYSYMTDAIFIGFHGLDFFTNNLIITYLNAHFKGYFLLSIINIKCYKNLILTIANNGRKKWNLS